MNQLRLDGASFRRRFALESFEEGGVLADLESGAYFELNVTATHACKALLETQDNGDASAHLGERLAIDRAVAQDLIETILADLAGAPPAPAELVGPFRYLRRGDVYVLEDDGRPVLEVDPRDQLIGLSAAATNLRFSMLDYVRAVTPKVLGLGGVTVLHASACTWAGQTVGFSGPSGAGKTTTMRAFASAGAAPISEDLVVLVGDRKLPTCYLEGERQAHAWSAETAAHLDRERSARVPFADLFSVASGSSQPLDEVWFVDSARRRDDTLVTRRMGRMSGFLALLRNTFLGTADASAWTRQLQTTRLLSEALRLHEVTTPQGLPALANDARRYVVNSAS